MKKSKTLKGSASLYIVAFITLLLGIISLSFVRVMVSNSARNTNTDLSQSALDSAQAGIEDARVAILRYHECLSSPSKQGCTAIVKAFRDGTKGRNGADPCDTVSTILGRNKTDSGNEAVVIQETQNSADAGNSSSMLQAYTCVKISEELDDYRTTLDGDNRSRIIPIRVDENKLKDVKKIDVAWFSDVNSQSGGNTYGNANGSLSASSSTVPMLSVQFFQADTSFKLSELNVQSTAANNRTDHFNIFLNPVHEATGATTLELSAASLAKSSGKGPGGQRYFNVKCGDVSFTNATADEFACKARLNLPKTFKGNDNTNDSSTFLFITMPTGASATDLSITLRDASNNVIPFVGVQALVDSTGRANDLYRRLETRLELVDLYYPYPEYELEHSGGEDCKANDEASRAGCIRKKTVVSEKCWYTIVKPNGQAVIQECPIVDNN